MTGILLTLLACTDNQRTKFLGGETVAHVPCDQVVFDVTWKGEDLWYATQPAGQGWRPETKVFTEYSSYGLLQGRVTLVESRCNG